MTRGGVIAGGAVTAVVLLGVLSTAAAPARPGRAVATHYADAAAVATQPNGRIVVVGTNAEARKPSDFALVRYLPNGRVDPSFGVAGRVLTGFGRRRGSASAGAIQADGKIVAAGATAAHDYSSSDFELTRYLRNGRLDRRFGKGGKVRTILAPGSRGVASAVVVEPEGKIVAAGSLTSGGKPPPLPYTAFALTRYLPDGSLDPGFGSGGKVVTGGFVEGPSGYFGAASVALQGDGKIVAAGSSGLVPAFALARYLPDGKLDPGFGDGGRVLTSLGSERDNALSVAIQPDGKILAAGSSYALDRSHSQLVVVRDGPDGSLDPGFGTGGAVLNGFGGGGGSAVAIQHDGKIVVAGTGAGDFALARFLPNGILDPSFGSSGEVFTGFGQLVAAASALAIEPDGKIVVAGTSRPDPRSAVFALARYLPDGSLDPSFGSGGKVLTGFPPAVTHVASLSATRTRSGVRIRWRTASEADTRGFDVYRQRARGRLRVNPQLIAATGDVGSGASYSLVDRRAPRTVRRYRLQEIKWNRVRKLYGPAVVRR